MSYSHIKRSKIQFTIGVFIQAVIYLIAAIIPAMGVNHFRDDGIPVEDDWSPEG